MGGFVLGDGNGIDDVLFSLPEGYQMIWDDSQVHVFQDRQGGCIF